MPRAVVAYPANFSIVVSDSKQQRGGQCSDNLCTDDDSRAPPDHLGEVIDEEEWNL